MSRKCFWIIVLCSLLGKSAFLEGREFFVETKPAFFLFTKDRLRHIYPKGGLYWSNELNGQLIRGLYLFGGGGFFRTSGSSIGSKNSTEISLFPFGLGVKQFFTFNCADFYVGGGPVVAYTQIKDHSPYVIRHSSKWEGGGIVKAAALCKLNRRFFAELFSDYMYMKVRFHDTWGGRVVRRPADLSAWSIGVGLRYRLF